MDKVERLMSYALMGLFVLVLTLSNLLALDLRDLIFHPHNLSEEVFFFILTAAVVNSMILLVFNGSVCLVQKIYLFSKSKE